MKWNWMGDGKLCHVVPFELDQIVRVGRVLQKENSAVHFKHFSEDDAAVFQCDHVDRRRSRWRGFLSSGLCPEHRNQYEQENCTNEKAANHHPSSLKAIVAVSEIALRDTDARTI